MAPKTEFAAFSCMAATSGLALHAAFVPSTPSAAACTKARFREGRVPSQCTGTPAQQHGAQATVLGAVLLGTVLVHRRGSRTVRGAVALESSALGRRSGLMLGVTGAAAAVSAAPRPAVADNKISASTVTKATSELEKLIKADQDKGPTLVRLAWHSSGTYDKMSKTGGSQQGTIRFKEELAHGGNAGLDKAVAWLEPIKKAVPEMSYADLYTLGGVIAVKTLGGPAVPWRAGRVDSMDPKDVTPDGRLPGADNGSYDKDGSHIRDIFYRMDFNDREIVALSGAHVLGRCHADASGFVGPWTPTPTMFNNLYFTLLKTAAWEEGCLDGETCKNHQYRDVNSKKLMMLPTDIALIKDPQFAEYVNLYADDKEVFFKDFSGAFSKLLENGTQNLYKVA